MNRIFAGLLCFIAVLITLNFVSCKHDVDAVMTPAISFGNDVKPIISTNCTQSGCHGAVSYSGFQLLSYDDIMQFVKTGDEATSCKLYHVITGKSGEEIMPPSPNSPLADEQIKTILLWMKQGAINN